ncbi:MAG: CPBP family intramembrane metalloprotease [Deltaproteobacteria bacterium]|nr:CPBP family intramembrane metalloprotease [Deltaproteobacteria bacterium]
MATKNIDLKTLASSAAIILAVEAGLHWVAWPTAIAPIVLIGTARILEGLLLVSLIHVACTRGIAAIGLHSNRFTAGFKKGLFWSAGFGLLAALGFLALYVSAGITPTDLIRTGLPYSTGGIFLFFLVGGIVSPVAKEIVFRGILYGYFRRWGVWTGVVFSTLLFVLAHATGGRFPLAQTVGGVVFALAYERERNLVVPMVIHILGNLAIFSISLF